MISFGCICVCVFAETNQMFILFRLFSEHKVLILRLFFRCRFIYFASLPIFALDFDHAIEKRVHSFFGKKFAPKTGRKRNNEGNEKKKQTLKKQRVRALARHATMVEGRARDGDRQ